MTHTPAPWRYEAGTKTIRAVPSNYWLASMNSWDGAVDHEANAHLIAAAPEMLAALKACAAWMRTIGNSEHISENGRAAINAAIAAIVKAEPNA